MTTQMLERQTGTYIDAEFARIVDELTRRGFLTGAVGAAALLGLSACGTDSSENSISSPAWSFTDDRGNTVTLPKPPARVAAMADDITTILWGAGLHVVATPMVSSTKGVLESIGATTAQIGAITTFGTANPNSPNLERLTSAKPDLILVNRSDENFNKVGDVNLSRIAPTLAFDVTYADIDDAMSKVDRFVTSCGIVLHNTAERTRYEHCKTELKKALASKPGLRVGAVFDFGQAGLAVNVADQWPWMRMLASLGMTFIHVTGTADATSWQTFSYERVPDLPVDLLLVWSGQTPTNPAWGLMPAVKAGQVLNTSEDVTVTYGQWANLLTQITHAVQNATPGIGPR